MRAGSARCVMASRPTSLVARSVRHSASVRACSGALLVLLIIASLPLPSRAKGPAVDSFRDQRSPLEISGHLSGLDDRDAVSPEGRRGEDRRDENEDAARCAGVASLSWRHRVLVCCRATPFPL